MQKIMHITYDMRIGGTEQVIKSIIEDADHTQFAMSVLCIEAPLGPFATPLQEMNIPIISLQRQPGFDVELIKNIRRQIKLHQIDIVHCHQYTPWIYGALAALGLRAKVIFTEHGRFYPDFGTWKRKLVNPILARFTSAITSISQATRHALVVHENLNAKQIDVIYNGIRPLTDSTPDEKAQLRESLDIASSTLVLGTIARFDPIKNHLMMINAVKRCIDAGYDVKLIIVGDGEMRNAIEQEINTLNLQQYVILTGYNPKPQQYLSIMDLFLLSSFSEGTSMTLLEAMSLSKPCVVTDAGGNGEVIEQGVNGFVTPNDDVQAFTEAIITLISDSSMLQRFAKASKNRFNQQFHVDKMTAAFTALYSSLLPLKARNKKATDNHV